MTEESTSVQPTPETEAPGEEVTAPAAAPASAPTAPEMPDWTAALDKVDHKELRRHPKIAGLIGSAAQQAIDDYKRRETEAASHKTAKESEDELLKLFEENADAIKERYPRAHERFIALQKERVQAELAGAKAEIRRGAAAQIGQAYRDLPEWSEFTQTEQEELAKALVGKTEDQILPTFAAKAADLVAERRAQKRFEAWKTKELGKEREALRKEVSAELLKGSPAPDLTRGRAVAPDAEARRVILSGSDEEFDKWYESTYGR
mgnify:CR=1 FL=1